MKKFALILFAIFLFGIISASCSEEQIDINSASAEELDKIKWVGPATAEKIISSRPFESLDELVKISGISDSRLEEIKEENLACVDSEDSENEETEEVPTVFEIQEEKTSQNFVEEESSPEVIKLSAPEENSKDIKTAENKESLDKNDYAKYGFVVFCVLIGFLFMLKNRKNQGLV